jgi:UTP--glucose-1-phosphate uridylyltransferase
VLQAAGNLQPSRAAARDFSILQTLPPGRGGEIQLTDGLARLVQERKIFGCEFTGDRYDIGDKFGFVRATVAYALKRKDLRDKLLDYLKSLKN